MANKVFRKIDHGRGKIVFERVENPKPGQNGRFFVIFFSEWGTGDKASDQEWFLLITQIHFDIHSN